MNADNSIFRDRFEKCLVKMVHRSHGRGREYK